MFVEEEHSIFMEMSERLYCFLLFIFIVLVWDIWKPVNGVLCSTSKAVKQLVQPENGDLLLMPKDRNLLK